jgi:ribonuclease P protein component
MKRIYRLRRYDDFWQVRKNGKCKADKLAVLCVLENNLSHNRFGFVVGKRIGKAVRRNRIRRRMREVVRLRIPQIDIGYDLVFIARAPIEKASYKEIEGSLVGLLGRAGLLEVGL